MNSILWTSLTLSLCFALYRLVTSVRHGIRARQLCCKAAPYTPYKFPLGIDNALALHEADKNHRLPQKLMEEYLGMGRETYMLWLMATSIVVTHDPKNVQAVLATQFKDFEIGPRRRAAFFPMLGNGIFTSDGAAWDHSRSMLRPQFSRAQVADLDLEERHVQALFNQLPIDPVSGWTQPIDIKPMFFRLTLDSASEFLFGESIHSQSTSQTVGLDFASHPDAKWADIGAAFDDGTSALGSRIRLADFHFLYNPQSFKDNCRRIHRFADHCIENGMQRARSLESTEKSGRYVFLDELIRLFNDPREIRSQLLNILLAGRDTTAGLLGWTFWSLARHPDKFQKLRSAIIEDFGTEDEPKPCTFAGLKSCNYLQHVIMEVLRLYPSVPTNSRQATRDTTLPRGGGPDGLSPLYVRAGQEVTYSVYVMQRRKDIWGQDADEFRPERWEGRKNSWEYLPFNGGPRICLGQQFALTEAGYVIVRMLQRFDQLEKIGGDEERHQYSVTTAPLNVHLRLRKWKKQ